MRISPDLMNSSEVICLSWTNEIYAVYDLALNIETTGGKKAILPISHILIKTQIEITIKENGDFVNACTVSDEESETIIPDTGKAKTGKNPPPYPLTESLKYIAGNFQDFSVAETNNVVLHELYLNQLKAWSNDENAHKAVRAILSYVLKDTIINDCINSNVLLIDEESGKFSKKQKYIGVSPDKAYVRFRIQYENPYTEKRTWLDHSLYENFIQYNSKSLGKSQLCYALGKELPVTYIHPYQIVKSNARAKIISTNDDKDFTYRGRFANKEEAISVSYDFSQKFHNALKWLIGRQGVPIDSLTLIVWASGLVPVPKPLYSINEYGEIEQEESGEYDSVVNFRKRLKECIFGYKAKFQSDTKAMIMCLDAATTGRLSISAYSEVNASQYIDNIAKWHGETMWLRFNRDLKKSEYNSFSIKTIANCAFGTEQGNQVECKKEVLRETTLRLLPCITEGRKLPKDIMNALFMKASNPLSYEWYNFRKVLETACGMIQKYYIDHNDKRGRIYMGYDPNITDRSYLFGCLLAIADKAESEAYDDAERNVRVTNARRYWNAFSQRPAQTWQLIEERLRPYLNKLGKSQVKYTLWMNEISNKLDVEKFSNERLGPLYLLGYHNFNDYMFCGNRNEKTEE